MILLGAIGIGAVIGWLAVSIAAPARTLRSRIAIALAIAAVLAWLALATPLPALVATCALIAASWLHLVWRQTLRHRTGGFTHGES